MYKIRLYNVMVCIDSHTDTAGLLTLAFIAQYNGTNKRVNETIISSFMCQIWYAIGKFVISVRNFTKRNEFLQHYTFIIETLELISIYTIGGLDYYNSTENIFTLLFIIQKGMFRNC